MPYRRIDLVTGFVSILIYRGRMFKNEDSLGYAIKRTQHVIRQAMDKTLTDVALTTPQYVALSALSSEPGLSNAALARRCFVTPQTMHQLTGGLASRGLIERSPHPQHGRVVQVCVTKAGEQLLEKAHKLVRAVEEKMTRDLSVVEKQQVSDVLEKCYAALDDVRP